MNTRSNKEEKELKETSGEKLTKQKSAPATEVKLETPEQSIYDNERRTTESTPMLNVDEQEINLSFHQ